MTTDALATETGQAIAGKDLASVTPPSPIDFATSARQADTKLVIDRINTTIGSTLGGDIAALAGIGFATSAKQDTAKARLDAIGVDIETLAGTDFASKTKQDAASAILADIKASIDALVGAQVLSAHEAKHQTLVASIDTTITLSAKAARGRISNWSSTTPLLVKTSAISSNTDSAAARVPAAASATSPGVLTLPFSFTSIHVRLPDATADVTVEGYH